jgi:putative membrane protein
MIINSTLRRRIVNPGLVFATTVLTCTSLQADHLEGTSAERFVQKALMGGRMEVEMGQLARQKGQSPDVKSLGATLVRDHTAANQRLEQIASTKNWTVKPRESDGQPELKSTPPVDQSKTSDSVVIDRNDPAIGGNSAREEGLHGKHWPQMDKLRSQSGQEFDKTFVSMAIRDHKKNIAEFEKCSADLDDAELKGFIDETLPKIRQHLQMAKSAARSVGVDESSITADVTDDPDKALGAPATGASGTRGSDKPSSPASKKDDSSTKERSSIDNNPDIEQAIDSSDSAVGAPAAGVSGTRGSDNPSSPASDQDSIPFDNSARVRAPGYITPPDSFTSGTVIQNNQSSSSGEVNTTIDHTDHQVSAGVENNKFFQKGDGKVLGLSTDKNDGKFWGIIPDPIKKKHNQQNPSANAEINVSTQGGSVNHPDSATSTTK